MPATGEVAVLVSRIVRHLPASDVEMLGTASAAGIGAVLVLRANASSATLRSYCDRVVALMAHSDPQFIAGALTAALHLHLTSSAERVDVVWTGPDAAGATGRLTLATVVDLIAQAQRDILLISYAAHDDANLVSALHDAAERGVSITLLLERSVDNPKFKTYGTPLAGLKATRLAWPAAHREPGSTMHAKVLVVDGSVALVGSANLTSRAMEQNLEIGVLVRGLVPGQLVRYVADLRAAGMLEKVLAD